MSVRRSDVNKCIGCQMCIDICPMDVFRYNSELKKSVIAYPDNCQSCAQCFYNCPTGSLKMANDQYGYSFTAYRATSSVDMNEKSVKSTATFPPTTK